MAPLTRRALAASAVRLVSLLSAGRCQGGPSRVAGPLTCRLCTTPFATLTTSVQPPALPPAHPSHAVSPRVPGATRARLRRVPREQDRPQRLVCAAAAAQRAARLGQTRPD